MSQYSEFLEVGFPIIMLFCSLAIVAVYFMDANFSGIPSGMSNQFTFASSIFLILAGIFLAWGPGTMSRLSIHIVLLGVAGFYGVLTNKYEVKLFFVGFGAFVTFLLIGSGFIFTGTSGGSFIDISKDACNSFFGSVVNRCSDTGYLMFLRVIGTFAIFVLIAAIVCILPDITGEGFAAPSAAPAPAQSKAAEQPPSYNDERAHTAEAETA